MTVALLLAHRYSMRGRDPRHFENGSYHTAGRRSARRDSVGAGVPVLRQTSAWEYRGTPASNQRVAPDRSCITIHGTIVASVAALERRISVGVGCPLSQYG
jgi:hypothetical protein